LRGSTRETTGFVIVGFAIDVPLERIEIFSLAGRSSIE
jgi:hypothetical protein